MRYTYPANNISRALRVHPFRSIGDSPVSTSPPPLTLDAAPPRQRSPPWNAVQLRNPNPKVRLHKWEEYRAHEIKESNKKEKRNWRTIHRHDHPAHLPLVEPLKGHIPHLNRCCRCLIGCESRYAGNKGLISFTVDREVDVGGEMSLSSLVERWIRMETEQIPFHP